MTPDGDALLPVLQAVENRRTSHLLNGDFDAVAGMLADTLVYGHSTGRVDDKASLLESYRNGTVEYRAIDSRLSKAIPITGDVALVTGVITIKAVVNGTEGMFGGPFMAVWSRQGTEWILQGLQATR